MARRNVAVPAFEAMEPRLLLDGQPLITEFMASNSQLFYANNPDSDWDWIEIYNPTQQAIDLTGWHLTDDRSDLVGWTFPAVTLGSGEYRLIFASGLEGGDPAHPGDLHADFSLKADNPEYLGLVKPLAREEDIVHEYAPEYPQQLRDVSYGLPNLTSVWQELVSVGDPVSYHVPTVGDDLDAWTALGYDDPGWLQTVAVNQAGLLVTEIETGDTDWLEIQNVSPDAVATAGWSVLVNAPAGGINAVNAQAWSLPASVASGDVLFRTDDVADNYWGSDITWDAGGSGWVMILDDAGTVRDFVAWGYTEGEVGALSVDFGAFTGITVGDAWTGPGAEVGDGAGGTPGPQQDVFDFGSTWSYLHPLDGTAPATADPDFDATWMQAAGYNGPVFSGSGEGLFGYGAIVWGPIIEDIGQPAAGNRYTAYFRRDFTVTDNMVNVGAEILSDDGAVIYIDGTRVAENNFTGADTYFTFAINDQYPDGSYSENVTRTLSLTDLAPGTHTIAVSVHNNQAASSDLGFDLRLFGQPGGGLGSALQRTGDLDRNAASDFAATDSPTRGAQNPGLTVPFGDVVPAVTGVGFSDGDPAFDALIGTDVSAAMQGQNASLWMRIEFDVGDLPPVDQLTLRMQYDAGFVAYLNGTPVAWRNAPAPLAYNSAATYEPLTGEVVVESIDISEHLLNTLQDGPNVLAIHGLNSSAADADFLILPELIATAELAAPQYMTTPTPGYENVEGAIGFVRDTAFSHDRGFYTDEFEVTITTDTVDAQIRYTTDGSKPTATTGSAYLGPVPIATTTVLRAAAFKPGYIPTNVDTMTYIFVEDVATQTRPAGYPTSWGGEPNADYEIDQAVSLSGQYYDRFIEGLTAIPSLSLVLPVEDMFGSAGLYSNTMSTTLEKETSAELVYADGTEGFQVDAGLKIQGGASRNPGSSIKHSMSLRFRADYGLARLNFPFLPDWPVDRFNSLHLRAMYNNSWIHWDQGQRDCGSMIRDQWMRDSLIAMGQIDAGNGTYVHLYVNGLYWGVYDVHERQDASQYAEYNGGDEDRIDAIKAGVANDGTTAAWYALQNMVSSYASGGMTLAEFQQVQQKLDVVNLIDYMIVNHYGGNADWDGHNWRAVGGGLDDRLWRIYDWDGERVLENPGAGCIGVSNGGAPSALFQNLRQSDEFRLLFADRLQKHFFNGGALTPQAAAARWMARATELDLAIIAESARWGDDRPGGPYTRDNQWVNEQNRLLNTYFPVRTNNVLQQYLGANLFSKLAGTIFYAPAFNQHGGEIPDTGFDLAMSAPRGEIWYTTDGSDPRLPGGALAPGAVQYLGGPIHLGTNAHVRARARSGSTWSALNEATFVLDTPPNVVITEIMYNPADPTAAEQAAGFLDAGDFEYVELQNVGPGPVDLAGLTFMTGVWFDFPAMRLDPGEYALAVSNADAFAARYGAGLGARVAGEFAWATGLDNGGEPVALGTIVGDVIQQFGYKDGWFDVADGEGYSLVVRDPSQDVALWDSKDGWRASWQPGGNPGAADPGVDPASIVVSEILTHQDDPVDGDWIELHNTGASDIVIGGWYLSDDASNLKKYRFADGLTLGHGAYLVLTETADFGVVGSHPEAEAFALSELGEALYLTAAYADGPTVVLAGYREDEQFGAMVRDVTFGRYTKSTGAKDFVALESPTQGGPNAGPKIGPVVINEVMYHPPAGGQEFIELHNLTDAEVPLYDVTRPENTWQFTDAIQFVFPAGSSLAPHGYGLVVPVTPATFRSMYGVPAEVPIWGPYDGALANEGERLELSFPGVPEPDGTVPYVLVEKLSYNDLDPWPLEPDGLGPSLSRWTSWHYGNDIANWAPSTASAGTPGTANDVRPHVVSVELNERAGRGVSAIEPGGIGVRSVEVRFNEPVQFLASAVTAQTVVFDALGNETVTGTPARVLSGNLTDTVRIEFDVGTVVDTWLKVTLKGNGSLVGLTDRVALDGEPNNGSVLGYIREGVEIPTGDGVPGGDAVFYVGSLRGDMWGEGFWEPAPDGQITLWDINGFTSKYQAADADADLWGDGFFDPTPNGAVNAWDINAFTTFYQEAMTTGLHLASLPTGGEPLAPGDPTPLVVEAAPAEAPVVPVAPSAETLPLAPAAESVAMAEAILTVETGPSAPPSPAYAPSATPSPTAASLSPDGGTIDLLSLPAVHLPLGA